MPNLTRIRLSHDPTTPTSPTAVRFSKSSSSVTLEFNWNLAATEASWVIETSEDLRSWQPAAVTAYTSYVGSGNMRISAIIPIGGESRRLLPCETQSDSGNCRWTVMRMASLTGDAEVFRGNGTTTNNLSCATCDPDGDGMNKRG